VRPFVGYVVFCVAVGAVLATFLPVLVPWYAVLVAVPGSVLLLADVARGRWPGRPHESSNQMVEDFKASKIAETQHAEEEANLIRQEPWYADAVQADEQTMGYVVPSEYFVLSLADLVKLGWATNVEVREAVRWANSPTPPFRWRNSRLVGLLHNLGCSDAEAFTRLGLYFWNTDEWNTDQSCQRRLKVDPFPPVEN